MRPKTIILLLLALALAILVWQSAYTTDTAPAHDGNPKKYMIVTEVIIALVLGYMIGRPSSRYSIDDAYARGHGSEDPDTLSDEDRDYIS